MRQETMGFWDGSGISWTICSSSSCCSYVTGYSRRFLCRHIFTGLTDLLCWSFVNSAIFIRTNAISNLLWKFQRYILVIEYETRPILPPPLVILCHAWLLGRYIRRKCQGKRRTNDNGLSTYFHFASAFFAAVSNQ